MQIGIDIRTLMDRRYSGVSEYTLNLVTEILKQDASTSLSISKINQYKLFYNSFSDISHDLSFLVKDNAEIIKTSYPNKIFNYIMQKGLHYPKIDQLFGADPASKKTSCGVNIFFMPHINFISLTSKSKSILTIHDLSFLRYKEFFSIRKNIWHKMLNVKKLVNRFNVIVAVSENTKNDIINLCKVDKNKVRVIYSGIDESFKQINNNDMRLLEVKEKYSLPDNFILYLGNIEPRKNVAGIIKAYELMREKNKDLPHVKLVLAGGTGWKAGGIIKTWQKAKYKHDIKFLGYIDRNDKVYLYNLASMFVYPSFYEGFGFPPLEAMACGTPVVTSFTSSLPEVIGDSAILVNPYNLKDVAMAIEQVLTNKELANILISKGFNNVKRFSWKASADKYLELFRNI